MKRILIIIFGLFAFLSPALATNSSVPGMGAATSVAGTDGFYCIQSSGTVEHECTAAQMAALVYSLMSGDATVASGGVVTLATVNSNVGSFGSATAAPSFTVNAKGLITAASSVTITPAIGSVTGLGTGCATWLGTPSSANLRGCITDETGTGLAYFQGGALGTPSSGTLTNATGLPIAGLTGLGTGVAAALAAAVTGSGGIALATSPTFATGVTFGFITGSTQCLHVNSSGVVSGTGSDCGSGSGAVSSVTAGIGVTVSPTTGAVVVSSPATRRDTTTTTDTITSSDKGTIVTESNASPVAVAITTTGFVSTDYFTIKNKGAGLATYTPSSGTINGAATIACAQNQSADLYFDGTNYQALANTCQLGALATLTPGTGVASQLANAVSTAGGSTQTIASGTATIPATAIAAGACGTAITVSAANVATTDVVTAGFAADPTSTTGFLPTAMLTIVPYPTSGNANFKVCNLTSSSITPTSTTINFRVTR